MVRKQINMFNFLLVLLILWLNIIILPEVNQNFDILFTNNFNTQSMDFYFIRSFYYVILLATLGILCTTLLSIKTQKDYLIERIFLFIAFISSLIFFFRLPDHMNIEMVLPYSIYFFLTGFLFLMSFKKKVTITKESFEEHKIKFILSIIVVILFFLFSFMKVTFKDYDGTFNGPLYNYNFKLVYLDFSDPLLTTRGPLFLGIYYTWYFSIMGLGISACTAMFYNIDKVQMFFIRLVAYMTWIFTLIALSLTIKVISLLLIYLLIFIVVTSLYLYTFKKEKVKQWINKKLS